MDAMPLILVIIAALVGLDLAAVTWGADSRESFGDDHAR
jgi:hypothetical protein